ncbi:MAG: hypothetical protein JO257_20580 [Deltaproteobacteria bacterium]|nr:hypothetical protein [Deltaproteobacteria bacterium]
MEHLERLRAQAAADEAAAARTDDDDLEVEIVAVSAAPPTRATTHADPMTMSILAEIERIDHKGR